MLVLPLSLPPLLNEKTCQHLGGKVLCCKTRIFSPNTCLMWTVDFIFPFNSEILENLLFLLEYIKGISNILDYFFRIGDGNHKTESLVYKPAKSHTWNVYSRQHEKWQPDGSYDQEIICGRIAQWQLWLENNYWKLFIRSICDSRVCNYVCDILILYCG
jgi:hypothetical protein